MSDASPSSSPELKVAISGIRNAPDQATKLNYVEQAGEALGKVKGTWDDHRLQFAKDWVAEVAVDEGLDPDEVTAQLGQGLRRGASAAGPAYISWGQFTMSESGLTAEMTKGKGKDAVTETVRIAAAFEILGASRDPSGNGWGKWIRFHDADGRVHERHVGDDALQGDPSVLCASLAYAGLWIDRDYQRSLVTYLVGATVESRVSHVDRTGWHEIKSRQVFVLPKVTIQPNGGNTAETVMLNASAIGPYRTRGTPEEWRAGVGTLASGHVLPVLFVSAALAGPLLQLAGQDGGGLHIFGLSSKGKTNVLRAAASVWGYGDFGQEGYVRSWRSTANGLEGVAASASDTALVLDEVGIGEARDLASGLYSLSNGVGKSRARSDGSLRNPRSWRVMIISSGEIPIGTKLAEDRARKVRAGQLVRMLDIPGDRELGFGVFDHAGTTNDAATLAASFKTAAISAYGTAGPAFVRQVIANEVDASSVRAMIDEFVSWHRKPPFDGQVHRAAERLGLIAAAGEIATDFGITPWASGEATSAANWALEQWIALRGGTQAAEVTQAIGQVRLFIEQHGKSRFERADFVDDRPIHDRAGWRSGNGPDAEWWILPQVWKEDVCAGLDAKMVAKSLVEHDLLRRNDGNQLIVKIHGRPTRVYALLPAIIEGAKEALDAA
jgi:putative DNA primase/helicase